MSLRKQDYDHFNLDNSNRPSSFKAFDHKKNMSSTESPIYDYEIQKSVKNSANMRNKTPINEFQIGSNYTSCNACEQKLKKITDKLEDLFSKYNFVMLKIQQFGSFSNLESTKYLETFNRLINLQKKTEKIEYNVWELRQYSKQQRIDIQKINTKFIQLNEEITKQKQMSPSLNLKQLEKKTFDQLNKKIQYNRNDQLKKLRGMHEALEDIVKLQSTFRQQLNDTKLDINNLKQKTSIMDNKQNLKFNSKWTQNSWKTKF